MKQMNELVEGNCLVVARSGGETTKEFKGNYNKKLDIVFMCVPSHYEILGYIQN